MVCGSLEDYRKHLKRGFPGLSAKEMEWPRYLCHNIFDDWWGYLTSNCTGGMSEETKVEEDED